MIKSLAWAPSNIALIKYMGKREGNFPENPSLSLTLDGFRSYAEVFVNPAGEPGLHWNEELPLGLSPGVSTEGGLKPKPPALGPSGKERVLAHLRFSLALAPALLRRRGLRVHEGPSESIELRTANTFPESSGIASSASSFAAVTLAAAGAAAAEAEAFAEALRAPDFALRRDLSELARAGSGSACRSFEGPWVRWEGARGQAFETPMPPLRDFVILVSRGAKAVPSSEAHRRVKSSPLWASRPERARARLGALEQALGRGDLGAVSRAAWSEAWEMHSLFHTSETPFTYWEPGTLEVLRFLGDCLTEDSPPIVTLDAGPNVHVLVEEARADLWRARLATRFGERFGQDAILEDCQGIGAQWVGGLP